MAKQSSQNDSRQNIPDPSLRAAKQPVKRPKSRRAVLANALNNLFLGIVLVSLLAIPALVYFTDTGARAKREIAKILMAAGAGSSELETELKASRARVQTLQKQVATLQAANATLAEQQEKAAQAAQPSRAPETPAEEGAAAPAEPAVPKELPRQEYELTRLFNGVGVRTVLDLQPGGSATTERVRPDAYEFEMKLKLAVPKPHQSIAELAALNPRLPLMLPGLEKLLGTSQVSRLFERLYNLKHERIKTFLTRLDRLETRHNYYDCETMLELANAATGQKALLVQGEMDVVADGSDGDRLPEVADYVSLSTHYQPTTSLAWSKRSAAPNPLLPRMEKELKEVEDEYSIKGLSPDRNEYLRNRRDELRRLVTDMKSRSYLVAEVDPFIVLPLNSILGQPGAPAIGDYAVVIHEDRAYPLVCGDAGPSWKFGEASLMVAKTIEDRASPYSRPVSDLKVTYLIFPGSADPERGPPDLVRWRSRCQELLRGVLGDFGEGYQLLEWRDHVAERRAKRESFSLVEAAKNQAAKGLKNAKEAAALVVAKRKLAEEAGKRLQAAKSAPAPPPAPSPGATEAPSAPPPVDLSKLQTEANAAQSEADEVALLAKSAEQAAKQASDMVATVEAAVARIAEAIGKPYSSPKAETTDVALQAFKEAQETLTKIQAEVKKTEIR